MTPIRRTLPALALALLAFVPLAWGEARGQTPQGESAQRRMDLRWALTRAQERPTSGEMAPAPLQRQLNADERAQLRLQLREHNQQFPRR